MKRIEDFPRIRLGVGGKPHEDYDMRDWVLSRFTGRDAEEMADAHIMLAQLALIYGNNGEVCDAIRMKLARTLDRIEAEKMEAFGEREGRT